jgi:indolepyruvate ferredoxin oxidoreductase beta subunit
MVNDQEIRPVTVSNGQAEWPADLDGRLRSTFPKLELLPALKMAQELGNVRTMNVVMIGALSNYTEIADEVWRESIKSLVKPKFVELNLKAFEAGKNACCKASL